jgi:hypothetical protein
MSAGTLIIVFAVLALVILSVRERIRIKEFRERAWDGSETKSSPFSQAIGSLIGTAGGIYLSMIMLFSFMEVQLPGKVNLFRLELEPLAAFSFIIAIIQPFVIKLWQMKQRF